MDGTKQMRTLWKVLLISVALLLVVVVIGWNRRWFTDEPAYKGKTVTEWLDSMALVDGLRKGNRGGRSQLLTARSSAEVTNDPALRALMVMGARAVPVLEARLSEQMQRDLGMPPLEKAQSEAVETWQKVSQPNGVRTPPRSRYYNDYQEARNTAAVLGLLAIGTNAGAGVKAVLEAQLQAAPLFTTTAFMIANRGLPERHDEIVAGITEGVQSTDMMLRRRAVTLTRTFPEDFQNWKPFLLAFARHPEVESSPEEEVREAALWALVTTIPKDDEIIQLAQETLANTNNPPHLRALAGSGLQFAGEKAIFALPVMRQALMSNTNSYLQSEVRRAIQNLERIANGRTNTEASIQEKK